MKKILSLLVIFGIGFGLTGCSSNLMTLNKDNIKNFDSKVDSTGNQKIAYFIRSNELTGSGLDFMVECNDKRFKIKKNGTFTACILNNGINTIGLGQIQPGVFGTPLLESANSFPAHYFTLDFPNKENFILIRPKDISLFIEKPMLLQVIHTIDADLGKSIIGSKEFVNSNLIPEVGYGSKIALLNPSIIYANDLSSGKKHYKHEFYHQYKSDFENEVKRLKEEEKKIDISEQSMPITLKEKAKSKVSEGLTEEQRKKMFFIDTLIEYDDSKTTNKEESMSRIFLFRNRDNGNFITEFWTKDSYLGGLTSESYLEIMTDKSEITLYSYYGRQLKQITLKLDKNKEYFVEADFKVGWSELYINLIERKKENFTENEYVKVKLDEEHIPDYYKYRIEKGLIYLRSLID